MEKVTRKNVIALWASKFPEVQLWLSHLQKKAESAERLYQFCEWAGKSPTELLALKENPASKEAEKLLDRFCAEELADFTKAMKYQAAIQVKSFFKWSYRALEKAAGIVGYEKIGPYNALSKEGLRKLYNRAFNPRDRALIPFVTSTGIAKETLVSLLWSHFEQNWETEELPCLNIGSELLKGHGKGKYAGVRQITFLTPEAKRELLVYKDWMEDKLSRKLVPSDHIWLETYAPHEPLSYEQLGNNIVNLSDNAKVPFSLHDGRRWVTTALESTGISSNWAHKIRGRKVRGEESPYSQPSIEALRKKFREAVPLLEFTSEAPAVSKEVADLKAKFEEFKKTLTPEELAVGKRAGIQLRKPEYAKADKPCEDGSHCPEFRQISEAEILASLQSGWTIVKELSNGQVIVKR